MEAQAWSKKLLHLNNLYSSPDTAMTKTKMDMIETWNPNPNSIWALSVFVQFFSIHESYYFQTFVRYAYAINKYNVLRNRHGFSFRSRCIWFGPQWDSFTWSADTSYSRNLIKMEPPLVGHPRGK